MVRLKTNKKTPRVALVVSGFNDFISRDLLKSCLAQLHRQGISAAQLTTVWVPGSFEIPVTALKLAQSRSIDAVICLGAVIRGGTPHFDFVCNEAAKGLGVVGLQYSLPVVFGVLTTDSIEQAIERSGTKAGNKGSDAALTAIEMVSLLKAI